MEILEQASGAPWKRLTWGEWDSQLRRSELHVLLSSTRSRAVRPADRALRGIQEKLAEMSNRVAAGRVLTNAVV
jgi:hypothetical protein